MSWQSPPIGAQHIDYRGSRFLLGRTSDGYALWDGPVGGQPLHTFPLTPEGWAQAWTTYEAWEGPSAQGQAAIGAPSPTTLWRRGQPLALQPMRAGQILDGAFKLYRMQFRTLVPMVAFVIVPFEVVTLILTLATLEPVFFGPQMQVILQPAPWVTWGTLAVSLLFVAPFLTGAVVRTAADAYLGKSTSVRSSYRAALPRIPSLLWVTLLIFLTVSVFLAPGIAVVIMGADDVQPGVAAFGFIMLAAGSIPSFFFFLRWFFASPIVVLEGARGSAALGRSWGLARRLTGKILGTTLLAWLMMFALLFILGAIFAVILIPTLQDGGELGRGFIAINHALNAVVTILITPFTTLIAVLLYFDARIRKEGFDLEVMAGQLGEPAPPGA